MTAFLIRRALIALVVLILVSIIVFFSIRLIPGDVVKLMVQDAQYVTPIDEAAIRHKLGLDVAIYVQYGRWISGLLLHGDLGTSLYTNRPVSEQIFARLPVTLELTVLGIIVALLIALPIGIYSAIRQDSVSDYFFRSIAILFITLPSFWIGTMVITLPSMWWHWTPPLTYVAFLTNPIENLAQFIIPSVLLGMFLAGVTMRMTRTMMLEVLRQDYIRTAWSKGLKERVVISRHALKNALIPVVTIIGNQIAGLLGGSVVLEKIFNLPGVGYLVLDTLSIRDYPLLSGINIVIAIFVLIVNIIVDMTYSYLDPRIRFQ